MVTLTPAARLYAYARLMRLDKPIGFFLLLWPVLWSLWLAAKGAPSIANLLIFSLGALVMRSAGCVINDYADRNFDGQVSRTRLRPLVLGHVSTVEALGLFVGLCAFALLLVSLTNRLTMYLSVGAVLLAIAYPFMKRYTYLPQVVLGAAFAWSIPMAFAAETGSVPPHAWLVYTAVVMWTTAYDTFYGMVDREEDIKIGVKSTAILFAEQDRAMTGMLQGLFLLTLWVVGHKMALGWPYNLGLLAAALLSAYQQWLIREREPAACFRAFMHNNWVGMVIFLGLVAQFALVIKPQ
ncbi:MAG TPA: 4-hydroxybenzoate octaprenyltransferase [Cellvibrionaceae bacterium]